MQGTQVQYLVQEDSRSPAMAKPKCLEPQLCNKEATTVRNLSNAVKSRFHSLQLESSPRAATKIQGN